MPLAVEHVETGDAARVADQRLAVDDYRARLEPAHGLHDQREARAPIETAPRVEPHPVAIAADDQPAAVVLDLVDPTPALSALVWMALEGRAGLSLDLRLVVQNDIQQ